MSRNNILGLWVGIALIGLGVVFMLGQILAIDVMGFLWPFFILAVGAAFFVGMVAGGPALGALAVPGSVISTLGLILLIQNIFGIWSTWSYAWGLIISGAGVGLLIFGSWSTIPDLRQAGRVVITVGLALFFVFGILFELGAILLGRPTGAGAFWAVMLILAGLYVIFGQVLLHRAGGPVSRSMLRFSHADAGIDYDAAPGDRMLYNRLSDARGTSTGTITSQASGVRKVYFHAMGDMTIVQGEREGLEIEASEAVKARIRSEVRGDVLEIRHMQDWLDWLNPQFWNITPIRYTLYVTDLAYVEAAGLGNMLIPHLATRQLTLVHSGAGNITIHSLEAETLTLHQAGLGNVEVDGRVACQEADLSGAGNYTAIRLESSTANIRLSGLGNATVLARETLDARVSGAGNVEFYGNPRLTQAVSGLGKVHRVG